MEKRMRERLSALGPAVRLPNACLPLTVIPSGYRDWMHAVLQDGKRLPPPDASGIATAEVVTAAARVFGTGSISVELYMELEGEVLDHVVTGMHELTMTTTGLYLDGRLVRPRLPSSNMLIGFSERQGEPLAVGLNDSNVFLVPMSKAPPVSLNIAAREISGYAGRFYVRTRNNVVELDMEHIGGSFVVASTLEHASQLFDGCVVSSMLGSAFVSLFSKSRSAPQVRIPELDDYRVIEAKYVKKVLMVLGTRKGAYDRLIFRFDDTHSAYDIRVVEGVSPEALNFVVLDGSGVVVSITEDGQIEAFSAKKDSAGQRIIADEAIGSDMKLVLLKGGVGFVRGEKIFRLRMV
jgi:hypothetical protein